MNLHKEASQTTNLPTSIYSFPSQLPTMSYHHHLLLLYAHLTTTTTLKWEETNILGCPSVDCGNGVKISYPFWVYNSTSISSFGSYCGYEGLEVTCKDKIPTLRDFSDNYTITKVDTDKKIVSLTDTDVVDKPCPKVKQQVRRINTPNLVYGGDNIELSFFFNCSTSVQLKPNLAPNLALCLDPLAGDSYVFIRPSPPPDTYETLSRDCDGGEVTSPVLSDSIIDINKLGSTFPSALKGGIKLTWKVPVECTDCERSRGYCGL